MDFRFDFVGSIRDVIDVIAMSTILLSIAYINERKVEERGFYNTAATITDQKIHL